ncbi:Sorcin [Galemys pyrenaicus]|uniref:Sorcin n=1 Tax=Galemys pyrenaicus TaxID=202257 RepID=A0A8J6DRA6_GALPY|nr:Sorcin [Galemys pyrenaicus]
MKGLGTYRQKKKSQERLGCPSLGQFRVRTPPSRIVHSGPAQRARETGGLGSGGSRTVYTMAYPGHPGASGGYYPGGDGQIDADELQRCLTQSGIAGGYKPFNLETCRLMVSMLDRDMSGTMGFTEFKELWSVLNGWRQHFISFDSDRSGTVDPQELQKALTTMGFRLSPQAVNSIAKRYSTNGKITFDDYIACCVKLRALTGVFFEILLSPQPSVHIFKT